MYLKTKQNCVKNVKILSIIIWAYYNEMPRRKIKEKAYVIERFTLLKPEF
jgi:hypothetical protein